MSAGFGVAAHLGQADVSVRRAARIGDAWLIVNTSGLGKVMSLMQTYRAALAAIILTQRSRRGPRRGDDVAGYDRRQLLDDPRSAA